MEAVTGKRHIMVAPFIAWVLARIIWGRRT
jgi:hypothetical protein